MFIAWCDHLNESYSRQLSSSTCFHAFERDSLKATKKRFPVEVFIMLCKVFFNFEFADGMKPFAAVMFVFCCCCSVQTKVFIFFSWSPFGSTELIKDASRRQSSQFVLTKTARSRRQI